MRELKLKDYKIKSVGLSKDNFNNIINLIDRAWKHDYGVDGFLRYDKEYFNWLTLSPEFDPELAIGVYSKKGELVGFNAVVPATYKWRSKRLKGGISTYLSIDPRHRGKGLARELILETVKRSITNKYDILLAYFDFKFIGKKVFESAIRESGIKSLEMKFMQKGDWSCKILDFNKFQNSIGLDVAMKQMLENYKLDTLKSCIKDDPKCLVKKVSSKLLETSLKIAEQTSDADKAGKRIEKSVLDARGGDVKKLLALYNHHSNSFEFAQHWSEPELKWYLKFKKIKTLILMGKKTGALTYFIQTIVSKKPFKVAWIDNGHLGELAAREQLGLINMMLARAKKDGCAIAVLPRLGYINKKPFIQSGFLPYPRKFELHGLILNSQLRKLGLMKKLYTVIR
jgi:GNAT superfamily N-acetyltransferase